MFKGLLYALVISILLGTFLTCYAAPSPQEEVEAAGNILPVEINLPVIWEDCGSWNGWYTGNEIHLCTDNLKYGLGVAREIYLHELGHAFIHQASVPLDRWKGNEEAAADEFAAVMSITQGHPEDVMVKARLWITHPGGGGPWDPHPSNYARAMMFVRLYYGYMWPRITWHDEWVGALSFWRNQLLKAM